MSRQGFITTSLKLDSVKRFEQELLSRTKAARQGMPGLERGREDVIAAGRVILRTVMEMLGQDEVLSVTWVYAKGYELEVVISEVVSLFATLQRIEWGHWEAVRGRYRFVLAPPHPQGRVYSSDGLSLDWVASLKESSLGGSRTRRLTDPHLLQT